MKEHNYVPVTSFTAWYQRGKKNSGALGSVAMCPNNPNFQKI